MLNIFFHLIWFLSIVIPAACHLSWSPCTASDPEGLECAQFRAPMDWANPDGDTISLSMSRVRARNTSARLGNLFFNPGGPGFNVQGYCQLQAATQEPFGTLLGDHFDIICIDPRGAGGSTPIKCDADLYNALPQAFPRDEDEYDQMVAANKAFGESCSKLTGPLVGHVDTVSTVKDLEAIRIALGDEKLNWLGISYGSLLGRTYAKLYPHNIRAMVLDSIVDASLRETTALVDTAHVFEDGLSQFFSWCSSNSMCALYGQEDIPSKFDHLLAAADQEPIPAPGCLPSSTSALAGVCKPRANAIDILNSIYTLILSKEPTYLITGIPLLHGHDLFPLPPTTSWHLLATALNQTLSGNATLLSSFIASPENAASNTGLYTSLAVGCLDWQRSSSSTWIANSYHQKLLAVIAPRTRGVGPAWYYQTQCVGWPYEPKQEADLLLHNFTDVATHDNILVVNGAHDPSSPLVWAHILRDELDNKLGGALLTRYGPGHTNFYLSGEARAAIETFLLTVSIPEHRLEVYSE